MNTNNTTATSASSSTSTSANDTASKTPIVGDTDTTKVTAKKMTKEEKEQARVAKQEALMNDRIMMHDDDIWGAIRTINEVGQHKMVLFAQMLVEDNASTDGHGNASRVATCKELVASKKYDELVGSFATIGFRPGAKVPIVQEVPFDEGKVQAMRLKLQDLILGKYSTKVPCGSMGLVDFHTQAFLEYLAQGYEQVIAQRLPIYKVGAGNRRALAFALANFLRSKTMKLSPMAFPIVVAPPTVNVGGKTIVVDDAVMTRINILENGAEKVGTEELTVKDYIKSITMLLRTQPGINQTAIAASVGLPRPTAQKYEAFARLILAHRRLDLLTLNVELLTPFQERLMNAFGVTKDEMKDASNFKGVTSGAEVLRYLDGDYNDLSAINSTMSKDEKAVEKIKERASAFLSFLNSRKPLFKTTAEKILANPEATAMEKAFANDLLAICESRIVDQNSDIVTMGYLLSYVVGGNRRDSGEKSKSLATPQVAVVSASLQALPGMSIMKDVMEGIAGGSVEKANEGIKKVSVYADAFDAVAKLVDAIGSEAAVAYIDAYEQNSKAAKKGAVKGK